MFHAYLASAYALKGNVRHAGAELAEARRLDGAGCCTSIARLKTIEDFGVQAIRTAYDTTLLAGLRKAGMPEE